MGTLTLKKKDFSAAIDLSQQIGMRFIERKSRYILQAQVTCITYESRAQGSVGSLTWVDVPLCPETYGPVK